MQSVSNLVCTLKRSQGNPFRVKSEFVRGALELGAGWQIFPLPFFTRKSVNSPVFAIVPLLQTLPNRCSRITLRLLCSVLSEGEQDTFFLNWYANAVLTKTYGNGLVLQSFYRVGGKLCKPNLDFGAIQRQQPKLPIRSLCRGAVSCCCCRQMATRWGLGFHHFPLSFSSSLDNEILSNYSVG